MNVSVYKYCSLCQNNQYLDIELQTDKYKRIALGSGQFKSNVTPTMNLNCVLFEDLVTAQSYKRTPKLFQ